MTPEELRDIHPRMTSQPDKVQRHGTGEVLLAMYYKRDLTNLAQIEAWLLDGLLAQEADGTLMLAGGLGKVPAHPGDFILQSPYDGTFMAFRAEEFFEGFDHRVGDG